MTLYIQEMQSYYDQRAAGYDASMGYDDPNIVERLQRLIATLKNLVAGRQVLELACGPCFWTQQVAASAKSILATDFNESTLEQAKAKNLPWDRVSLQQADAYELNTVAGQFDAVLAVDWFAHIPKSRIPGFLSGVTERVTEGSLLLLLDQLPGPRSLTNQFDEDGNHIQERSLAGVRTFKVIKHFFSDREQKRWLSPYVSDIKIQHFPECRRVLSCGYTDKTSFSHYSTV